MADAQAKKRVHQQIETQVKPAADKAFAGITKACPELARVMKKVQDGIRNKEAPELLRSYRRELTIKLRGVTEARSWAVEALATIEKVAADDADFEADAEEIEALQTKLAKARDLLADQIVKGKDLEDRAQDAADKGDKSEQAVHRGWDTLIAEFESETAMLNDMMKTMRKWQQDANAALKARDRAGLKKAKENADWMSLDKDVLDGKLLLKRTNEFLSKVDLDSLSKPLVDEIAKDRATTIGEFDKRAQALEVEAKKIQAEIAKLRIAPPDAVKATGELRGGAGNLNTAISGTLCGINPG